jgi:hypothetical protein
VISTAAKRLVAMDTVDLQFKVDRSARPQRAAFPLNALE